MFDSIKQPFKNIRLQPILVSLFSVVIALFVFYLAHSINIAGFIETLELKTYDLRAYFQQGDFANQPSRDIVIIKFDDPTLNNFEEKYGTWPWNRQVHADMINWLSDVGARAMIYDLMFAFHKHGDDYQGDLNLIKAFKDHKNVYLGMNLDNNRHILNYLNKSPNTKVFKELEPLAIQLKPEFPDSDIPSLPFGFDPHTHFFSAPYLTFNNVRSILPELQRAGERIGLVNHVRDKDGLSRHNPVIFQLRWTAPQISTKTPYKEETLQHPWYDKSGKKHLKRWVDTDGRWIDERGCLIVAKKGSPGCSAKVHYNLFPYMGLRVALDLMAKDDNDTNNNIDNKKTSKKHSYVGTLSKKGVLSFDDGRIKIPVDSNGMLAIKWYNVNIDRKRIEENIASLETYLKNLKPNQQQERVKVSNTLSTLYTELSKPFSPKPYTEISAWKILQAIQAEKEGAPNAGILKEKLNKYLHNKIIFIGTTAVSTFDIKTTPIASALPGVIIQATLFDNIYQQNGFVERLSPQGNIILTGILALICSLLILKSRSAWLGFFSVMGLSVSYIIAATLIFFKWSFWLNIAGPILIVLFMTTITYMVKYISRDRAYEKTYKLATTDAMTGLKNHRFFQEHMLQSIERANRLGLPFSLLLVDIDYFKKFNDTYGHQAGDRVLIAVAKKLEANVRIVDLVARYGGEEMTIVLENTGVDEALLVANKIVEAIAAEPYPIAEGVSKHVNISAGVSTYPTHALSSSGLIEFADKGLYLAKENGRNQVGFIGTPSSIHSEDSAGLN